MKVSVILCRKLLPLYHLLLISKPLDGIINILIARYFALQSRCQSQQYDGVGWRVCDVRAN